MAFLTLPSQLTSPLDAVNALISTLGETAINTIDPPPTSDAEAALARLNEVDLEVQTRGWHWNREYAFPLSLDGNGHVPLPDQTLHVSRAYMDPSNASVSCLDFTQRGSQLYDLTNHTLVFVTAPYVDIILRLDWDSLPQAARSYITLEACQRFHARLQGSSVVLQVNASNIKTALATLEQREDEAAKSNSVDGNLNVINQLYGIGGLRRNRGGL